MNIELNYEGNKYSFDVDSNKGINYLSEIASRVFNLQRNSFNLTYQRHILTKDDTPLRELFNHNSSSASSLLSSVILINIELKHSQRQSSLKQANQCSQCSNIDNSNTILSSRSHRTNITCGYCNSKSAVSSAYCSTCDLFLCSSCTINQPQSHNTFSLLNGGNTGIALYQKNLFSRLNAICNTYKRNSTVIKEINESINDIFSQSKRKIDNIIETILDIQASINNETMQNDTESVIDGMKQQILLQYNDSLCNSNAQVSDEDIEKSFKELNRIDKQMKEYENKDSKFLFRFQPGFLSKVLYHSKAIVNSMNDLLIQLKGIMTENKTKEYDIIQRLNAFISSNGNNELSERIKSHKLNGSSKYSINYHLASLSPLSNGNGTERNIHDLMTSESSSLSYQLQMNNTSSYKPVNDTNTTANANTNTKYKSKSKSNTKTKEDLINQLGLSKHILSRNNPNNHHHQLMTLSDTETKLNHLMSNFSMNKNTISNSNNNYPQLISSYSHVNGIHINTNNNKEVISLTLKDAHVIPVKVRANQFRSSMKSVVSIEDKDNINVNDHLTRQDTKKAIIRFIDNPEDKRRKSSSLNQNDETRTLINNLKVIPKDNKLLTIKEFPTEKSEKTTKDIINRDLILFTDDNRNIQGKNDHILSLNNASDMNPLVLSLSKITAKSKSIRKKRKLMNKYDFLI